MEDKNPVSDEENYQKYYRQERIRSWIARKKVAISVLIVLITLIIFVLATGIWKKIPLVPDSVFTEDEMKEKLENQYGNISIITVQDDSMLPAYKSGQRVFVATDYYRTNQILRGDVVGISLKTIQNPLIKRVAAAEAEIFSDNGDYIYLDNSEVRLTKQDLAYTQLVRYGYKVPNGTVVILGDNPSSTQDSKHLGLILTERIIGKIVK